MTTNKKDIYNPAEDLPFDIESLTLAAKIGAWFAIVVHQQIVAIRNINQTLADTHLGELSMHPRFAIPLIMHYRHVHAERLRKYKKVTHDRFAAEIFASFPVPLPSYFPPSKQTELYQGFEMMMDHLYKSFGKYLEGHALEEGEVENMGDEVEDEAMEVGAQDRMEAQL